MARQLSLTSMHLCVLYVSSSSANLNTNRKMRHTFFICALSHTSGTSHKILTHICELDIIIKSHLSATHNAFTIHPRKRSRKVKQTYSQRFFFLHGHGVINIMFFLLALSLHTHTHTLTLAPPLHPAYYICQ